MMQGESDHPPGVAVPSTGRTLFALLGAPLAWAAHFLGSYTLVAVGCVAGWSGIRESVAAATVALAAVALWATVAAWRAWRATSGDQAIATALIEPRGWFAFLMLTGVLLGGIAVFTILLEGFGSLVLPECEWNVHRGGGTSGTGCASWPTRSPAR